MTKKKFYELTHHYHPETKERVIQYIYENKSNPSIRGTFIGTLSQMRDIPILEGWEYKYRGCAATPSFETYKSNDYKVTWAQQILSTSGFFIDKTPEIQRYIKDEDIVCDEYLLDNGNFLIVISIDETPRTIKNATYRTRKPTPIEMKEYFIEHGLEPHGYEYHYREIK